MRNPSEQEQVLINKRVSSYLVEEVFRLVLTSIVFIVLGVGLLYNHFTTVNDFGSILILEDNMDKKELKQITTKVTHFAAKYYCLLSCKDTNLKANHNLKRYCFFRRQLSFILQRY